jgi:uncharacterized protein DUF5655
MATDYGEKERAFIDGLQENSGRDLTEWMAAISAESLPHRNDVIDWLRRQGFTFSKASWLERIHHNGGKPIYADSSGRSPRPPRQHSETAADAAAAPIAQTPPQPAAPVAPAPQPAASTPAPQTADLSPLLAKAKAYRPLAQALINRIKAARPSVRIEPHASFLAICDPEPFAYLGIGPKELRFHIALGEHAHDGSLQKGVPGGGLGKNQTLSHMLVLTDARQIDQKLMDLVQLAAKRVHG